MFIATAITNQSKLCRSATEGPINIALLRSCERKQTSIYKHFIPTGFMCPRNLLRKQELRPLLHRSEKASPNSYQRKSVFICGKSNPVKALQNILRRQTQDHRAPVRAGGRRRRHPE